MSIVYVCHRSLLPADDDGAVRVMHDVVGDGAHDGAADGAHASGAQHDEGGVLLRRDARDHVTRLHASLDPQLYLRHLQNDGAYCSGTETRRRKAVVSA